jgi:sulfite reductase (ferredoxin)
VTTASQRPLKDPPSLELVLKRNPVERLKREKSPLGMLDELPALIATGYEDVAEEDLVRLKWWGLYHDKPKIGTFMLRIKLPAGRTTPEQLRTIGELSKRFGRGEAELSTRQNVQLHFLELSSLPTVFAELERVGLTSLGGCGDAVRAITGCPAAGVSHEELFDTTPLLEEAHAFFTGHPDYSDLPRKHKISIAACPDRCNAPEINCISLVGVVREGVEGFAVLVGGGLSSVPRIARDLGVFIRKDEAMPVLCGLLDAWREDLRYRLSRVKSRMKFMVDDYGPEGVRAQLEERLGYALPSFTLPALDREPEDHLGIRPQKQDGLVSIGIPVHLGLVSGEQFLQAAALAETFGGEFRITRQQNLILVNVPEEAAESTAARLAEIGLAIEGNRLRGHSIACTGEPHCNFAVTETKTRLDRLIQGLEERFGDDVADLRLHLDGCPHACAHHWVGDIGFQGSTVRDAEGKRREAYDIFLRGALGPQAAIARAVFRRVPSEELDEPVTALIAGWLEQRIEGESFRSFCDRLRDDELGAITGREPSRNRADKDEEVAA